MPHASPRNEADGTKLPTSLRSAPTTRQMGAATDGRAGEALWAAALVLISVPAVMPLPVRALGGVAALLFAVTALQVFAGRGLTPLSEPLPFFAYPVFVLTLLGWAWWSRRPPPPRVVPRRMRATTSNEEIG